MQEDIEIWKSLIGFEGCYEVSNTGKIQSIDRYVNSKNNSKTFRKGQFINPRKDVDGYMRNVIKKDGKSKCVQIHREVAKAFLSDLYKEGMVVNHKNGIRDDNRLSNLEWITIRENVWHSSQFKSEGKKTSKYIGVQKLKNGKWNAYLWENKSTTSLGNFKTEIEAHNSRLMALKERNIDATRSIDNSLIQQQFQQLSLWTL